MNETHALQLTQSLDALPFIDDAPRCKDGTTIEHLIMQFVMDKYAHSRSDRTAHSYLETVNAFREHLRSQGLDLILYSQDNSYDTIRVRLAEEAKAFALFSKRHRTVAEATRNLRLAILSSFYAFAEMNLKVPFSNPLALVKRSKVEAYSGAVALEPEDVKAYLQAIDTSTPLGMRDYTLLHVLFNTGRRVQDVLDLTWGSVRLGRAEVVTLTFPHMKGGKRRTITLDKRVSRLLLSYLHEVYGAELGVLEKDAPLWVNMSPLPGNKKQKAKGVNVPGSALSYQAVRNICIKHLDNLGKVHTTRHSHVRLLQEAGANIEEIQEALDHSNIGTTQIYTRHLRKDANKYTEQVASLLGL